MVDTPNNMKATQSSLRDEIMEMRKDLVSARKNMELSYVRNQDDHAAIMTKIVAYDTGLAVSVARDEEKSAAEKSLRRQVLTLTLAFLSIIVALVAWAATEFRDIHRDVAENSAHFREFQAIGIEWGDNLDARDAEFKEDLRQLRRLVNEHQRNKEEHVRHKD